jgi:hypothetical protein
MTDVTHIATGYTLASYEAHPGIHHLAVEFARLGGGPTVTFEVDDITSEEAIPLWRHVGRARGLDLAALALSARFPAFRFTSGHVGDVYAISVTEALG